MKKYEEVTVEIIKLSDIDIIATSKPFNGPDDDDWLS